MGEQGTVEKSQIQILISIDSIFFITMPMFRRNLSVTPPLPSWEVFPWLKKKGQGFNLFSFLANLVVVSFSKYARIYCRMVKKIISFMLLYIPMWLKTCAEVFLLGMLYCYGKTKQFVFPHRWPISVLSTFFIKKLYFLLTFKLSLIPWHMH